MNALNEPIKLVLDAILTAVAFVAWLTTILPALASLASLIWACIRIYEWYKEKKDGNKRINRLDS